MSLLTTLVHPPLEKIFGSDDTSSQEEVEWLELLTAMEKLVSAPLTSIGEHLLVRILRFEGSIRLSHTSDGPHAMSPTDMLKSLSLQGLAKWTGSTYLLAMERVKLVAGYSPLAAIASKVIKSVKSLKRTPIDREEIETLTMIDSERSKRSFPESVKREKGLTYLPDRRIRRHPSLKERYATV